MLRSALQRNRSHPIDHENVPGEDMTRQLTVRLPEDLGRALDAAASSMARKRSEVVRIALQEFLEPVPRRDDRPADRVRHLIGSLESGVPDLAENHRRYLIEALRDGR